MPRSELWGAILLITRIHANVCARLGVDASYVTEGAHNRARLEKGANGDLWGLLFAVLDLRRGEVDLHKVSSHIEGVGQRAVTGGFAELVDIIGNCMVDEVAELAVKLLRPPEATKSEATRIDNMAFLICIRLVCP